MPEAKNLVSRSPEAKNVVGRSPEAKNVVGLSGVEPLTSPLSGVRSNQLSYRPFGCPSLRRRASFLQPIPPLPARDLVELTGIEPVTS